MIRKNKEKKFTEELISSILEEAITNRASDIHIEPLVTSVRVRFRIDGILQEKFTWPLEEYESIINKIKVLADLDITNHTIPQDGHFEVAASSLEKTVSPKSPSQGPPGKENLIDVRVSVFPTIYGEAIVLRLLNRAEMLMPLENLGMHPDALLKIKKLILKTYGMFLATGPAGSGKTTLLYSILNRLKDKEKNIITLEDPVEFNLSGVRQSQMNPAQKLTFASAIRSVLRQDPDVIMIGEIRDPETAEYAIRAALSSRSVFSTIHSNSTVGTVARLIDMGVERSIIAYALNGVISERLVRKICSHCQVQYTPNPDYLKFLGFKEMTHQFIKGKGCDKCNGTGYLGRTGVFEVFEMDDNLRSLVVANSPMSALQEYTEKIGMRTLIQDVKGKVLANVTTVEEAIKVV